MPKNVPQENESTPTRLPKCCPRNVPPNATWNASRKCGPKCPAQCARWRISKRRGQSGIALNWTGEQLLNRLSAPQCTVWWPVYTCVCSDRLAQRVCPLYRQSGSLQCLKSDDVVQTSRGEHYIMSKSWAVWGVGLHVWSRCSVCPRIHCRPSTPYVIHGEYTLVLLYTTSHTMSRSSSVSRLAFCRDFISCPTIPPGIPTDCPSLNNFWIALKIPSGKVCQEEHFLERPSNSFLCMYLCLTYMHLPWVSKWNRPYYISTV